MSPAWKPPAPPGEARQLADGLGLRHGTPVLVFAESRWRPARVSPSTYERINRRSVPVTWEQDNGLNAGKVVHIEWVAATPQTRTRAGYDLQYLDSPGGQVYRDPARVTCPTCQAPPEAPCQRLDGGGLMRNGWHPARENVPA